MREIKELAENMKEELDGAEKYAKMYLTYKNENQSHAKKLYEMAEDELKHAMYLHEIAIAKIKSVQSKEVDVPDFMMMLWEDEHKRYIDNMTKVKIMLTL